MKTLMKTLMLSMTMALSLNAETENREISYAIEDAASRTLTALAEDVRVKPLKSIAFVKLNMPNSESKLPLGSNLSQVFEATLAAKPQSFALVTHSTHTAEWKLIDGVFDQAADFESYDPKTHPALNKLKLADALLFGQVIDARMDKNGDDVVTSVRIAMRLIKISTGEQLWGKVIEGKHAITVDQIEELKDQVKGLLTFTNILYALAGLVGLIVLLFVLRQMIRVR